MRVLIGGIDGIHLTDSSSKDGPFQNLAITAAEKILSVLFLSVTNSSLNDNGQPKDSLL